jgi:hypothetical protein
MVEIAHLKKKIEKVTVIGDRSKRYALKKQQRYRYGIVKLTNLTPYFIMVIRNL